MIRRCSCPVGIAAGRHAPDRRARISVSRWHHRGLERPSGAVPATHPISVGTVLGACGVLSLLCARSTLPPLAPTPCATVHTSLPQGQAWPSPSGAGGPARSDRSAQVRAGPHTRGRGLPARTRLPKSRPSLGRGRWSGSSHLVSSASTPHPRLTSDMFISTIPFARSALVRTFLTRGNSQPAIQSPSRDASWA